MHKGFVGIGALLGAVAVALGAFGAHGLKKIVTPDIVQTFQTGVQYQMYHALGLVLIGLVYEKSSQRFSKIAGKLFIAGIILFSGSLYVHVAGKAAVIPALERAALITPLGGLCFIAGWLFLFFAVVKK